MKTKLLILFMLLCGIVNAQIPDWTWAKSAGGTSSEDIFSIATDPSGNIYATGQFSSPTLVFGTTTLTNYGSSDIFLVKYDANGNVLWAKSAGGTTIDAAFSVTVDASGNAYMTGYFQSPTISFGTTSLTNATSNGNVQDIFIAKYNSLGTLLWAKRDGGTDEDGANSIKADISGNIFVAGYFCSSSVVFGTTTLTNAGTGGTSDIFLAKYDPSGNVVWAISAGGTNYEGAACVTTNASGEIYITGGFSSYNLVFGSTTLTNMGYSSLFLTKYDASGNVLWAKSAGNSSYDGSGSVTVDLSGNVYITGYFQSPTIVFGTTTLTNADSYENTHDMFIAKYSCTGSVLWAKRAGSTWYDKGTSVTTDASGNVYALGWFEGPSILFGTTTLTNTTSGGGYRDIYITKYDSSGYVAWAKKAGGTLNDYANSVTFDASGNIYLAGSFSSPTMVFGSITLTNPSSIQKDIFIVNINTITSVYDNPSGVQSMTIFPNPFSQYSTIKFDKEIENVELNIYNLCGQKVKSVIINSAKEIKLYRDDLKEGIYFIKISTCNNILATEKLIIVDY